MLVYTSFDENDKYSVKLIFLIFFKLQPLCVFIFWDYSFEKKIVNRHLFYEHSL